MDGARRADSKENYLMHCSNLFQKVRLWLAVVTFFASLGFSSQLLAQNAQRSPSETVRQFYKAMGERRFRDAFAMSIYRPAIEGLSDQEFQALRAMFKNLSDSEFAALRPRYQKLGPREFEDLRPDFERMAAAIPAKVDISGEQISGDSATVFMKVPSTDEGTQTQPVNLIRVGGAWIIGDKENEAIVKKAGKDFFFNARIDTHHNEVQAMLQRISLAQLAYSQQHKGFFADMPTLITVGLLPKDLEGTESTGYRFHVTLAKDRKSFSAGAEPSQYGRTGRLSFFMDKTGVRSGDLGGKPLTPAANEP
jgi:hypothetical protein